MTQPQYQYALHPQDARIVMVRIDTGNPLHLRGRHQDWRKYGIFASYESAAIALEALRQAQVRERMEVEA